MHDRFRLHAAIGFWMLLWWVSVMFGRLAFSVHAECVSRIAKTNTLAGALRIQWPSKPSSASHPHAQIYIHFIARSDDMMPFMDSCSIYRYIQIWCLVVRCFESAPVGELMAIPTRRRHSVILNKLGGRSAGYWTRLVRRTYVPHMRERELVAGDAQLTPSWNGY